ncbi:MAG: phosphonopyruvate decarboxylase [Candidatus Aminicenantes bacterium]|nr:phosphonopyruvate decarboxylase [Candidatus Aminicenantes bacterium]
MISPVDFSKKLHELGFETAVGVPDSTFKGLISYFSTQDRFRHVIAANECEAMGIAAGYYLAHREPALVYMQNSGFCKTLNPYTSMLSEDVYGIPALLLVGWRGEPGQKDEPQHKMMGRIMTDLFKVMEIEYSVLEESQWESQLTSARDYLNRRRRPYIIAVKSKLFAEFKSPQKEESRAAMTREEALNIIVENTSHRAVFISTTGKTSRELFEIRQQKGQTHGSDFYTVGSMGCASAIAFGVGLAESDREVFILDGDGAAIMQLGTMATIGHYKNPRLKHIILDNHAHESTGGQPTVSAGIDFIAIGRACGYENVAAVDNAADLKKSLQALENNGQLSLLAVQIKKGSRSDLGRPTTTPQENRDAFTGYFRQ